MADADSKGTGGRIATTIGLVVSSFTILGLFVQVVAYVIAASYFRSFGVEPTDAGISPINAAFRLNNTFISVILQSLVDFGVVALIATIIVTLLVRWWLYFEQAVVEAQASALREVTTPASQEEFNRRLARYREYVATCKSVRAFSRPFRALRSKDLFPVVVIVCLIFMTLLAATIFLGLRGLGEDAANQVVDGTIENTDSQSTIDYGLHLDIPAPLVQVEWAEPAKKPAIVNTQQAPASLDGPIRVIASLNGHYYLYVARSAKVLVVNADDVRLVFDPVTHK